MFKTPWHRFAVQLCAGTQLNDEMHKSFACETTFSNLHEIFIVLSMKLAIGGGEANDKESKEGKNFLENMSKLLDDQNTLPLLPNVLLTQVDAPSLKCQL